MGHVLPSLLLVDHSLLWEDTWDGITLCLGGHVGETRGWDTFVEICVVGTLALMLGHFEVLHRKEGL